MEIKTNLQLACLLSIEKKNTYFLNSKVGMWSPELGHLWGLYHLGPWKLSTLIQYFIFFYLFLFSEPSDEDINLLNL